jgi:hypothetical protein
VTLNFNITKGLYYHIPIDRDIDGHLTHEKFQILQIIIYTVPFSVKGKVSSFKAALKLFDSISICLYQKQVVMLIGFDTFQLKAIKFL